MFALAFGSDRLVAGHDLWIRAEPELRAPRVGMLAAGTPFEVTERKQASGCAGEWARVEPRGWACLRETEATEESVEALPVLVDHVPPRPADFETYLETGAFESVPTESLLPFVYGRIWKRWKGRTTDLARTRSLLENVGRSRRCSDIVERSVGRPRRSAIWCESA